MLPQAGLQSMWQGAVWAFQGPFRPQKVQQLTLFRRTGRPCCRRLGSSVCGKGPSGPSNGPAGSTKSSAASVPARANSSDLNASHAACTCSRGIAQGQPQGSGAVGSAVNAPDCSLLAALSLYGFSSD